MGLSRRFVRDHDLPICFLEKGEVHVRVGQIATHTFDFLNRGSVLCTVDGEDWYEIDPGPYPMRYPDSPPPSD